MPKRAADRAGASRSKRSSVVAGLHGEAVEQFRQPRALRLVALVPPQDEDVEQPVAEGVARERRPALRPGGREQLAAAGERVEVLADHHGVHQDGAVREHQGRDLAERVVGQQVRVRLASCGPRCGRVSMRSARPSSCAATITLRTKGERGDQWSFMRAAALGWDGCSAMGDFLRVPADPAILGESARVMTFMPALHAPVQPLVEPPIRLVSVSELTCNGRACG